MEKVRFERVNELFIRPHMEQAGREGVYFRRNTLYYAGFIGDQLVGFFGVKLGKTVAQIRSDYTFPEFRRQGILRQSVEFRLADLKGLGIKRVTLGATPMAVGTHVKCGARIIREAKHGTLLEYEL